MLIEGPSSLWDILEVRAVNGLNDIQRGAAYHCQLAGSYQRRPLGLYTNLSPLQSSIHQGWPSLFHLGSDLHYDGPLPPSCPCLSAHASLKGVDSREEFHSSCSSALGVQFWWLCVVPFLDPENASLGVGESAHAAYSGPWFSAKSQWYPIRTPLLSFSSASSSLHGLFSHWRKGDLTRQIFIDYVGPDVAAKYFSGATPPSDGTATPLRTIVVEGPSSASTSSSSTGRSQTPLVTWSLRGHGGTHGGSLRGATTAGFFGSPGVSISPRHVLPGDPGTSTVSPSRFSGQSGLPTDVSRNVRDDRGIPPLILGFSYLVEVGVNLINPVDRVSVSIWTGRAVIQACGCGHP